MTSWRKRKFPVYSLEGLPRPIKTSLSLSSVTKDCDSSAIMASLSSLRFFFLLLLMLFVGVVFPPGTKTVTAGINSKVDDLQQKNNLGRYTAHERFAPLDSIDPTPWRTPSLVGVEEIECKMNWTYFTGYHLVGTLSGVVLLPLDWKSFVCFSDAKTVWFRQSVLQKIIVIKMDLQSSLM